MMRRYYLLEAYKRKGETILGTCTHAHVSPPLHKEILPLSSSRQAIKDNDRPMPGCWRAHVQPVNTPMLTGEDGEAR
jgi:hypothetical protein